MTGLLVLLVGVLFGGLQSVVLAQDGGKVSYPTALERLESLVASLNESLHETKEDLQEVRLCLNQTKKTLGEVQREKESLKVALLETRSELATTKILHQRAIDELRASQNSSRVEALERQGSELAKGLKRVRKKVSGLEDEQLSERISAIENEQLPRQLNELTRDLRRLEDENLPRRVSSLALKLLTAEFRHNFTITILKEEQRQIRSEVQMLETELETALTAQDEQVANMVQELTDKQNSLELKLEEVRGKLDEVTIGEAEWEFKIASSRVVEEVKVSVRVLDAALSNMTAVTGKGLSEAEANFSTLKDKVEMLENELCEKVQNVTMIVQNAKESSEQSLSVIKQDIARSGALAAEQQMKIDRLTTQVTWQDQSVNQLNDSVTDQEGRLDKLTRTVEEQGTCIARLKEDVQQIKMGPVTDCYNAMVQGANESGVYTIHPINANNSFNVYCDMETDGGGWTVLLKRQDGSVDFQLNWTDYKRGFGNLEGEHWLGLDNMYLLTNLSSDPPQLRVDLADWEGNTAFAKYDQFSVGDEDSDYTLSVSGYQSASTAGDSFAFSNGQRFSTPDRDNDAWSTDHCAVYRHGPWWHKDCHLNLLTGKYFTSGGPRYSSPPPWGIIWYHWLGHYYSLRYADMKIRPGGV